jgi:protoporphyrinogen oxidase
LAPDLFQNTFELIKQLGLAGDTISISPHAGQFYKGRVYHHRVSSATGLLSFKGLGLMDKALLPRMAYLLSRHSSQLQFHRPEVGLAFDNESAAAYVKRELSQSVLNYVAGPLISTLFFYGSEETSAWLYLILAKHMSNLQMSTIRGGVGRIAEALTRQLRIVHRPVNQIAVADSSYVVGEDRFSDVVFAIPGNAVLRIGGIETLLSEEDRRFFLATRYQRVVSVQVATETPIDGRCYAVSIPRVERRTASTVSFQDYIDPSSVPLGQGLVTVSGGGPDVTGRQLLGDLEALYPKIHAARVDSWEWASGMAMFPPGRFREIAEFQNRKRRSGLFFCGDYVLGPLVEGAITTGLRVAAAIQT